MRRLALTVLVSATLPLSAQIASQPTWLLRLQVGHGVLMDAAGVGDLDLDGFDDVATFMQDGGGRVFSGRTGSALFTVAGFATPMAPAFGRTCGVSDCNGDGVRDLAIAIPLVPNGGSTGLLTVVSGSNGTVIWQRVSTFLVSFFGISIAEVGDLDGDGVGDFAVCGITPSTPSASGLAGAVFIVSGATGTIVRTIVPFPSQNPVPRMAATGDLNGDGFVDILVSIGTGIIVAYSASGGNVLRTFSSGIPGDGFGTSFDAGRDLDGDGTADVVVGAPSGANGAGIVYVWSGSTGVLIRSVNGPVGTTSFGIGVVLPGDLNGDNRSEIVVQHGAGALTAYEVLDGATGVVVQSFPTPTSYIGGYVFLAHFAAAGDVNADGWPDMVFGTPELTGTPGPTSLVVSKVCSLAGVPRAAAVSVGAGCGGTASPLLACQPPVLGAIAYVGVLNAAPSSPGMVFLGAPAPAPFAVGPSCLAYLDAATLIPFLPFTADALGRWWTPVIVPFVPVTAGMTGRIQAALPGGGGPAALQMTNAVDLRIGY